MVIAPFACMPLLPSSHNVVVAMTEEKAVGVRNDNNNDNNEEMRITKEKELPALPIATIAAANNEE